MPAGAREHANAVGRQHAAEVVEVAEASCDEPAILAGLLGHLAEVLHGSRHRGPQDPGVVGPASIGGILGTSRGDSRELDVGVGIVQGSDPGTVGHQGPTAGRRLGQVEPSPAHVVSGAIGLGPSGVRLATVTARRPRIASGGIVATTPVTSRMAGTDVVPELVGEQGAVAIRNTVAIDVGAEQAAPDQMVEGKLARIAVDKIGDSAVSGTTLGDRDQRTDVGSDFRTNLVDVIHRAVLGLPELVEDVPLLFVHPLHWPDVHGTDPVGQSRILHRLRRVGGLQQTNCCNSVRGSFGIRADALQEIFFRLEHRRGVEESQIRDQGRATTADRIIIIAGACPEALHRPFIIGLTVPPHQQPGLV